MEANQNPTITVDQIIKHFEILIKNCEKLKLDMEEHVKRNQYFSNFVKELSDNYKLVKIEEPKDKEEKEEKEEETDVLEPEIEP